MQGRRQRRFFEKTKWAEELVALGECDGLPLGFGACTYDCAETSQDRCILLSSGGEDKAERRAAKMGVGFGRNGTFGGNG